MKNLYWHFGWVFLFLSFFLSKDLRAEGKPLIESIGGDKIVVVHTARGNREVSKGYELEIGDWIKTGSRATVRIFYPDGSHLLVGRNTEFEIKEYKKGAQWNELRFGEIRGLIQKSKNNKKSEILEKHHFIINTKAAILGVRGTDFVMEAAEVMEKSEIHTLDGTVEVAKDDVSLLSGKGVSVGRSEFVIADAKKITEPASFNSQEFIRSLNEQQPDFEKLNPLNTNSELETEKSKLDSKEQLPKGDLENKLKSTSPQTPPHPTPAPAPAPTNKPESVSSSNRNQDPNDERNKNLITPPSQEKNKTRLFSFQIQGVLVFPTTGAQFQSLEVSWNPYLSLINSMGIRGLVGGFPMKKNLSLASFETGAFFCWNLISSLVFELGLGNQLWPHQSNQLTLGANAVWLSESKILGLFDRFILGTSGMPFHFPLSSYFNGHLDSNFVREYKIGFGMSF